MSRHRWFGITSDEYIERLPVELDIDAVGLWQIIPVGRHDFQLSGDDLTSFARRCLMALFESGAVPVRGVASGEYSWIQENKYGHASSEMADAILKEWLELGAPDPHPPDSLWFATPSVLAHRRSETSDRTIDVIRQLLDTLDPASFRVEQERTPHEQRLLVDPNNESNASFWIAVGDRGTYDFGFGHGPYIENISIESDPPLNLVRAVIAGRVTEELTIVRGKVSKSSGRLHVAGGATLYSTVTNDPFGWFGRKTKKSVRYDAYPPKTAAL